MIRHKILDVWVKEDNPASQADPNYINKND